MKLIPTQSLSNWKDNNPEASWSITPEGSLQQTKVLGTTKNGSGGKLIFNKHTISNERHLELSCIPGSVYQTGLIFNYLNDEDYSIVFIDRKSASYAIWDLAVGDVKKGKFQYLCKESFSILSPETILFELDVLDGKLEVKVNQEVLYVWPGQELMPDSHVGVYSQKNTDAEFVKLEASAEASNNESLIPNPFDKQDESPIIDNPTIDPESGDVLIGEESYETAVKPFLRVKEPVSESIIEFKRAYRVSLDSLYSSIYLYSELKRPMEVTDGKLSRAVPLDYRPKRWYREYNNLLKGIELAGNDVKRADTQLNVLENNGVVPENMEVEDLPGSIKTARENYLIAQDKLEQLVNEKNELEREMRIAGYMIRTENVPTEFEALGYKFYIVSGVAGYKDFEPIDYDPHADYKDDKVWKTVEATLKDQLFKNKRFSKLSQERYSKKTEYLKDKKSHLPLIQNDLNNIQSDITTIENQIKSCKSEIERYKSEKTKWHEDKEFLMQQSINFRVYNSGEYPVAGNGAGPPNNEKFKNFLVNTGRSDLKVFRYQLSTGGNGYSVHVNQYDKFSYYHDYRHSTTNRQILYRQAYYKNGWDQFWGKKSYRMAHSHYVTDHHYHFNGDRNIRNFFTVGNQVCDHYINQVIPTEIEALNKKLITLENNKIGLNFRKTDLEENGLKMARMEFLDEWNRSDVIETTITGEKMVDPNSDPLTDLLADLETNEENPKVYNVTLQHDGYYTQDGQALQEFIQIIPKLPHSVVLILPVFDRNGKVLPEVRNALVNPQRSNKVAKLPVITFVETYQTKVNWKGYSLGELTQTINLFPGESKELVIESSTRTSTGSSEATDNTRIEAGLTTNSFESALANELQHAEKSDQAQAYGSASNRKEQVSDVISNSTIKSKGWNIGGSIGYGPASINAGYNSTTTKGRTTSKMNALEELQSTNQQKANKESKESFKKEIDNTLKRIASETSSQNKISFRSIRDKNTENMDSRKETIYIENPNIGRTVNYNFFQLQNTYETKSDLIDVKIVLDPGIELLKSSEVTDVRVFELEEFNKIYANSDEKDPRSAILGAIVSRQVIKNYMDAMAMDSLENVLVSNDPIASMDTKMLDILSLSNDWGDAKTSLEQSILSNFKDALTYLKSRNFKFNKIRFIDEKTHAINTGSYYLDAEVGAMPSTEIYLEERREIEADIQRAGLEHMKAQTKAGVFYPNISNVNSLSLEEGLNGLKTGNGTQEETSSHK